MDQAQAVNYTFRISPGIEGIRETLALMRSIVRRSKADPRIVMKARLLTQHCAAKDWRGETNACFLFVRDRIRYIMDPVDVEALTTPTRLMDIGQGDCDDKATLLCALLESIGHPTRFVAIGFEPGALSHVYVETRLGATWIPLETTERVAMGELPFDPATVKNRYTVHN